MNKRLLYAILIAGMCSLSTSCSDFLTEEDHVDLEKENYMNSASEAENVLLGIYSTNCEDGMYGFHLSFYLNLGTDMEQVDGEDITNYRPVPCNAFQTTDSYVQKTWQSLYKGIYRANDFLERVSRKMTTYSQGDQVLAAIYIGEARALRAMYYFELVRRFGNVPLFTSTAMSSQAPSTYVQADPVDVYKFIEDDLKHAVEVLPYATDDDLRSDGSYRFSKGAALGLLAKVYATWAGYPLYDETKWEQAAVTAGQLINSGKHDLLDDFEQLWQNAGNGIWDPTESLIEISFYSPTVSGSSDPVGRIGKWNGVKIDGIAGVRGRSAGNVKVVHTFVLDWRKPENEGDRRRNISIANYRYQPDYSLWVKGSSDTDETAKVKDSDETQGQKEKQNYTPGKWDMIKYCSNPLVNDDKSNVNWYFLRYADVLLIYAEALNEWKGYPTDAAYAAVNKVRRRAYNTTSSTHDLQAGMDQESFREAVRKERAYELAFEGHRRMDLVRWGIYYETIQQTYRDLLDWWSTDGEVRYLVQKYTVKGKHELLPIPQRDKDLCPNFKQNPGW